ncbi:MAG TPA: RDD family protein [Thermoanaerobaculia bacterium]|nr:RDD family protein [Thermoanaerobaculia bacterium]
MRHRDRQPDEPLLFDLPLDRPGADLAGTVPAPPEADKTARADKTAKARQSRAAEEGADRPDGRNRQQRLPAPRSLRQESAEVLPLTGLFTSQGEARPGPSAAAVTATATATGGSQSAQKGFQAAAQQEAPPRSLASATGAGSRTAAPVTAGRRFAAGAADLLVHLAVTVGILVGARFLGVHPVLADWPAVALFVLAFSFLYMVVPLAFWGHTLGMAWAGLTAQNVNGEPLAFGQTARRWLAGLLTAATLGLPLLVSRRRRSLSDLLSGSRTYGL